jgi:hypothetical protein
MVDAYTVNSDNDILEVTGDPKGVALLLIVPKAWESQFFNRKFAEMTIDVSGVRRSGLRIFVEMLREATRFADKQGYCIVETSLEISGFDLIPTLEDAGFRLVDSKMTFFTRIEKAAAPDFQVPTGTIDWAERKDLEEIIILTKTAFVDNPRFISRFNNRRYFSHEESCAYYKAWVENHFGEPGSLFAVWRQTGRCIGYFFYQYRQPKAEIPVLKGMLAAVDRRYQNQKAHLALQRFVFDHLEHPVFFVDNTTQFSNFPVIKNHITTQRRLKTMSMVFYRERQATLQ